MTTDDNFGNEITLKVNDSAATAESEEKTSPQTLNRSRKGARRIVLFTRTGGPTEATDEWMMTYMDTVTLLITLFVLLLSFSTIKEEKYQAVAQGLSLGKYGSGILMGGIGLKPASVTQSTILTLPGETPPAEASLNGRDRAQEVADKMTEIFEGADLKGLVGVTVREDTVDLELNERVLFTTGIAELTDLGLSIIDRVAPPLRGEKFHISVEGHTDNIPISTERFPSNWELSGARASSVARRLVSDGVDATRLRIVGYADTHPTAPNDTTIGRQQNRRVSIRLTFDSQAAE